MRKLSISKVKSGMVLARKVYSPNGHVLLVEGTELNDNYLTRIQALGYSSVLIQDSFNINYTEPPLIPETMWMNHVINLKKVFDGVLAKGKLDTSIAKSIVNIFTDEIVRNRFFVFEYPDIRPFESYLYGHSLNVCLLSLRLGLSLGYNEFQLRDLGLGALLHDVGEVHTEQSLIEKAGKLTPEEFEEIQKHTSEGFKMLREQNDINLLSSHVAFQHHERCDGTGYPRKLKSNEICEYARVVAIADMFDALTSERKHRKSYSLSEALTQIHKMAGVSLDGDLVNLFCKYIASYPVGTLVALDSGEIGMVIKNSVNYNTRPIIKMIVDSSGVIHTDGLEIDLSKENKLNIVKEIDDDGFINRLNQTFA